MTKTAENTIPNTVGINNFRNNLEIFICPKSILSLIALRFYGCKSKVFARNKNYQLVISLSLERGFSPFSKGIKNKIKGIYALLFG
jgi:hypothetical protein